MLRAQGAETVLVLNAGSSSLKYQVVDPAKEQSLVKGHVDRIGTRQASVTHDGPEGPVDRSADASDHDAALRLMTELLRRSGVDAEDLMGVGHRVVHGGPELTEPVLIDDDVLAVIDALARLAPLHNPPAAAGIRSAMRTFPELPQVAVFDTTYFRDLPRPASTYALDVGLAEREGLRRYGMHGISHAYVAGEVARFLPRDPGELDQIVLHLGNGASASAVRGGRPVETSMGLTPLEGLVMGTRAGDLDPGLLLHLLRHGGEDGGQLTVDELEDLLHHRSGLEGLAGVHDFREVLEAMDGGDDRATLAYDVYCHRIRKYVGAYLAVLDGAEVVTFTAGVGENVPRVRAHALEGLDRLGIVLDPALNNAPTNQLRRISAAGSRVEVLVVPTNEELAIAREVVPLIG